ncbi:hypothetical protein DFA_11775 [Cavenderia fasciculata]|uniref:Transmembrane protein n=1 Tax=Cavenderia fasciculata TaxID=261658 RepID=F4QE66_CACFS|nr:uncharacterized protein DFA_11775 [Cavenderia fasciculata]EGG14013.1 hypothetical protein DFA_11775 [Cavenderia fasciculata]|eukprot:XP_004350721.1 hypothetical protein DFA_11775 [Cavenderia fasciculata]
MNKILGALGLADKPKTIGGKILRGVQIISIPLFIFVVAARPIAEERHHRRKLEREREIEEQHVASLNAKYEAVLNSNPHLRALEEATQQQLQQQQQQQQQKRK